MITVTLKDRILNAKVSKPVNSITNSITCISIDEETDICIITKTTEFINAQEFAANISSKIEISVPVLLSDKDMEKFWIFYNTLKSNEKYKYTDDFNLNSRARYIEVYFENGEKYLISANDNLMNKFNDIYMSEVQKYLKVDKLKYK